MKKKDKGSTFLSNFDPALAAEIDNAVPVKQEPSPEPTQEPESKPEVTNKQK